jgi:integrase
LPREKKTRTANGRSSIFHSEHDNSWHGYVTVGVTDSGAPDRRHVRGKTNAAVAKKVRDLERRRDEGKVRKPGQTWTVEQWLDHWLNTIVAPPTITQNAWDAYDSAIRIHLIPGIGAHRLNKLEPEHLERLYRKMMTQGRTPSRPGEKIKPTRPATAHQAHRTIRAALNEAVRRRHISENPALLARAPKVVEEEIEPYSVDEIKRLLEAAQTQRNSARWAIALAVGLRQGEALGLRWPDIDEAACALTVRRNRLRPRWKHGCATPCGHQHAGHCPQRVSLREETGATKSKAGNRIIGLPDELVTLLQRHRTEQDQERATAAELWHDTGYVFTTPTGQPLNMRTDHREWKLLIARAGVAERRLHDARHTAATVLLLLGVAERTVMGVMGWSNTAMAARYQHITATIRRDVAQRVGGLLWEATGDTAPEPPNGDPATGAAAQMQPQMQPRVRTDTGTRSSRPALTLVKGGGSGGIRTPGPSRVARFQGECIRPLCHASECTLAPCSRTPQQSPSNVGRTAVLCSSDRAPGNPEPGAQEGRRAVRCSWRSVSSVRGTQPRQTR